MSCDRNFDIYVKDGINCVCVKMVYACREFSEGRIAGFIVCVCARRKRSQRHVAGSLGGLLCTGAYRFIFVCSVV